MRRARRARAPGWPVETVSTPKPSSRRPRPSTPRRSASSSTTSTLGPSISSRVWPRAAAPLMPPGYRGPPARQRQPPATAAPARLPRNAHGGAPGGRAAGRRRAGASRRASRRAASRAARRARAPRRARARPRSRGRRRSAAARRRARPSSRAPGAARRARRRRTAPSPPPRASSAKASSIRLIPLRSTVVIELTVCAVCSRMFFTIAPLGRSPREPVRDRGRVAGRLDEDDVRARDRASRARGRRGSRP